MSINQNWNGLFHSLLLQIKNKTKIENNKFSPIELGAMLSGICHFSCNLLEVQQSLKILTESIKNLPASELNGDILSQWLTDIDPLLKIGIGKYSEIDDLVHIILSHIDRR